MSEKEERKLINKNDGLMLNKFGDRLRWVRESIGITKSDVANAVGMSNSSYHGRENGVRSTNTEEYLVIAEYFNSKWETVKNKKFNGKTVNKITPQFLMWGIND